MYYLIQQPTPSQLMVKSNTILNWIFATAITGLGIYLIVWSWFFLPDRTFNASMVVTAFAFFLFAMSVWLFHFSTVITTFNKSDGFFTQERKWLWKNETIQHPIQTIRDIHVFRKSEMGKDRKYFKIILELDSGEMLPLSSASHMPEQIVRQQALGIRTFIELAPNKNNDHET